MFCHIYICSKLLCNPTLEVCNGGTEITSNKEDPVTITIKCSRNNSTYKNELTTKYEDTKMVTFANDFSAGGKLKSLLQ